MANMLERLKHWTFGYDAVVDKKRRKPPRSNVVSEDEELKASERRKLIATAHDIRRNYIVASWMIRKHLDYVSTFTFQSKNRIPELDARIEELVKWWSLPWNLDVAGKLSLRSFIRMAEAMRTLSGDFFILKLSSGRVQGIEGDRIANPTRGTLPPSYNLEDFTHGIKASKAGRAKAFILNNRLKGGGLVFNRVVPAKHMIQHGYWDRIDALRSVSPLAPVINHLQDTYEGISYSIAKAKVSQFFAIVISREDQGAIGELSGGVDSEGNIDESEYDVNFGSGPCVLYTTPGDKANILESNQPSSEFQAFTQLMIQLTLKALDIPYSFFDESFTNYSGSRQGLNLYEQSAAERREDNRALLDELLRWRLAIFVMDGILKLPAGTTVADLKWRWQHKGIPWVDPIREVRADYEAVEHGLTSRQAIAMRMGRDWFDILDELKDENAALKEAGFNAS